MPNDFSSGHDQSLPYGPNGFGSPLDRLADAGGHIMLIGVTHASNTILHLVLYRAGLPFLEQWRDVVVAGADGVTRTVRTLHPGCSLGFDRIEPYLVEKGAQKTVTIGDARVRYMKASDVIAIGLDAVQERPALLLCDRPECGHCRYTERMLGIRRGE